MSSARVTDRRAFLSAAARLVAVGLVGWSTSACFAKRIAKDLGGRNVYLEFEGDVTDLSYRIDGKRVVRVSAKTIASFKGKGSPYPLAAGRRRLHLYRKGKTILNERIQIMPGEIFVVTVPTATDSAD